MSCSVQRTHSNGCFQWYSVMWTKRVKLVEVELVFDYTCLHGFKVRDQLTSQNKPVTRRKLKQEILLEQVMIIIHQQHNKIALKYVISFPFLEKKRKRQKNFSGCGKSISRRYLCSQMWKHFVIQPLISFVICTKHFSIQPLILYFTHQEGIVFALE